MVWFVLVATLPCSPVMGYYYVLMCTLRNTPVQKNAIWNQVHITNQNSNFMHHSL